AGTGSFSNRIAHHWCEVAQEADARGRADEAEQALSRARESAPQAARPLVIMGQRFARQNEPAQAMQAWDELMVLQPQTFSLIAMDYAKAAQACGAQSTALTKLDALYTQVPSIDILNAWNVLQPDAQLRRQRLIAHVTAQPSLSAAQGLIRERLTTDQPLDKPEIEKLQTAMATAAKPLQRYRCAACGFESQHYFWQCPGCQGWDTYPPRRLEDQ
ncbi:MAG: lipopolysaccharide assembly protein LapB, partial [Aquabacterium sp.]|nr:lipopolysaccharide assembly protein LapB [Aquabacterium sp.]